MFPHVFNRVIMFASSAEPDPGVTRVAISVLVSKDTDSCFGTCSHGTLCVEAFPVTGELQGSIRTNHDYHLPRPSEVLQYCPSAISEYRELALLVISIKLIWLLILISKQILEKDVFQEEGSLVSSESKPVLPPSTLQRFLSCQYAEV